MALIPRTKVVTVLTAGTRVPLLQPADGIAQNNIVSCIVQAVSGTIYLGDNTVLASGGIGHQLVSGNTVNSVTLTSDAQNSLDLARLFVDGAASGAKANITLFQKV